MSLCHQAISALTQNRFELLGEPTTEQEFLLAYKEGTGVDETGTVIFSSDPADFSVTWSEVSAKKTELETAEPMRLLRAERNQRIAETDWWASSDLTMTAEQTAYRQALRDITNTYSSLDDVVWPTKL